MPDFCGNLMKITQRQADNQSQRGCSELPRYVVVMCLPSCMQLSVDVIWGPGTQFRPSRKLQVSCRRSVLVPGCVSATFLQLFGRLEVPPLGAFVVTLACYLGPLVFSFGVQGRWKKQVYLIHLFFTRLRGLILLSLATHFGQLVICAWPVYKARWQSPLLYSK